jgi:CBS domain-containing protein
MARGGTREIGGGTDGEKASMRVRDLMSRTVLSVPPDRGLKAVARLLERNRVSAVPVVEDGRVIGVLSKTDLVRREQAFELESAGWFRRRFGRRAGRQRVTTVEDAMTSPAVTVSPTLSAVGAAWLMTEHDAHHLPVVERGKLVGIVSRSDLVRGFARSDEQIKAEIVTEILPSLEISPNDVEVSVSNGEVILSGALDDELSARYLPHAVRRVIGVVEVDCRPDASKRYPLVDAATPTL